MKEILLVLWSALSFLKGTPGPIEPLWSGVKRLREDTLEAKPNDGDAP